MACVYQVHRRNCPIRHRGNPRPPIAGLGYLERGFALAVVFGKAGRVEAGQMPRHTSWHWWGPLRALRERGGVPHRVGHEAFLGYVVVGPA
jgi:hypothetical protein